MKHQKICKRIFYFFRNLCTCKCCTANACQKNIPMVGTIFKTCTMSRHDITHVTNIPGLPLASFPGSCSRKGEESLVTLGGGVDSSSPFREREPGNEAKVKFAKSLPVKYCIMFSASMVSILTSEVEPLALFLSITPLHGESFLNRFEMPREGSLVPSPPCVRGDEKSTVRTRCTRRSLGTRLLYGGDHVTIQLLH